MSDVVICEPLRTPVGGFNGALKGLSAADLGTIALTALMERTGLGEGDVDDVILGNCNPSGEAPAIGRVVALNAGLGTGVPGLQIDRRCGSGLQAVLYAAMQVGSGAARVVVAGGTESMSQVEHYALLRQGVRGDGVELADRLARARVTAGGHRHPVPGGMIETAENLRREYGISRQEQDELALRSQQNTAAAVETGHFTDEIVPVTVPGRRGKDPVVVDRDEHPRPDTTLEGLAGLRPIMGSDPGATVTAGNSSGQNDAAALCVVTTREEADRRGLRPMLALRSWAVAGVGPEVMGIGPVPATAQALERAGLTLADIDLIELNEAFAAQVLAVLREWKLGEDDWKRLNVNGSGISLGHPVGATGARILATMAYEMQRRGSRYGLETMCIGGGQGLAAVFEAIA
jgi:acetyl-CoA C-acetyltransferase